MPKPRLGLIALNRDVVIEEDMHSLLDPSVTVVTTRIPLETVGTVAALGALEGHLAPASALLPLGPDDVVAFACTSAVAVIGSDAIAHRITEGRPGARVVTPLQAIRQGLQVVPAKRAALVTPYGPEVSDRIVAWLDDHGVSVAAQTQLSGSYRHYADIPPSKIREASVEVARDVEAILIACTDLRATSVIDAVEGATGVPVLTSNQALAWSVSRELDLVTPGPGRLFRLGF